MDKTVLRDTFGKIVLEFIPEVFLLVKKLVYRIYSHQRWYGCPSAIRTLLRIYAHTCVYRAARARSMRIFRLTLRDSCRTVPKQSFLKKGELPWLVHETTALRQLKSCSI